MYYSTNNNLQGMMNLYAFSPASADLIRPLLDKIMHDEDYSPIPIAHREVLAYKFHHYEENRFMASLHGFIAINMLGEQEFSRLASGNGSDEEPEKIFGLKKIVHEICYDGYTSPGIPNTIRKVKEQYSVSDREIHDTILICSIGSMLAQYIGYSGLMEPDLNNDHYAALAREIAQDGYDNGKFKNLNC